MRDEHKRAETQWRQTKTPSFQRDLGLPGLYEDRQGAPFPRRSGPQNKLSSSLYRWGARRQFSTVSLMLMQIHLASWMDGETFVENKLSQNFYFSNKSENN